MMQAKSVLLQWFLVVSLRTWRHGRCLGWQPCRWGSGAGWWRSRHTPPGDRRGWIRWTPACPCRLCRSSPPAAASAAPLGWAHSLWRGISTGSRKNDERVTTSARCWPLTFFSSGQMCSHSRSTGALPHLWLWRTQTKQDNCNLNLNTITHILHFHWVT